MIRISRCSRSDLDADINALLVAVCLEQRSYDIAQIFLGLSRRAADKERGICDLIKLLAAKTEYRVCENAVEEIIRRAAELYLPPRFTQYIRMFSVAM